MVNWLFCQFKGSPRLLRVTQSCPRIPIACQILEMTLHAVPLSSMLLCLSTCFRGGIFIYRGDGETDNKKLIISEHGSFVFIRSAGPQAGGDDRKKRGGININQLVWLTFDNCCRNIGKYWCEPDQQQGSHVCKGTRQKRLLGLQNKTSAIMLTY